MKAAPTKKPLIRIAVVEGDPLRFAGFHALFDSERMRGSWDGVAGEGAEQ